MFSVYVVLSMSNPYPPFPFHIHISSDFEAVVDVYLSHYQSSDAQDMGRTCVTITAPSCLYEDVQMSRFSSKLNQAHLRTWGSPRLWSYGA